MSSLNTLLTPDLEMIPAPNNSAVVLAVCSVIAWCHQTFVMPYMVKALIRGRLGHDDAGQQHCIPPAEGMHPLMAQVTIDNCTSSNYSVVSIMCKDRKGLIYDLMRTLKDIHVRVAYAKIKVHGEMAETDLFVEEADGQRMKERCAEHLPCSVSSLRTQESRMSSTEVLRLLETCALASRACSLCMDIGSMLG